MLRPRIIPCLLVRRGGLIKTQQFGREKYVGDPLNAVKIFNEKAVDELIVLDIDATVECREPNFDLIRKLAYECRMPFCYGGGVKTVEHAREIIRSGAEKVAFSSALFEDQELPQRVGDAVGRQSVIAVLDVKAKRSLFGSPSFVVHTRNGRVAIQESLDEILARLRRVGVGEIVVNSIDRDGMMAGYDLSLARFVRERVECPVTFLGGAGSFEDIVSLYREVGVVGAAAGSLFVFRGKYKAVLISYPSRAEKAAIIDSVFR